MTWRGVKAGIQEKFVITKTIIHGSLVYQKSMILISSVKYGRRSVELSPSDFHSSNS